MCKEEAMFHVRFLQVRNLALPIAMSSCMFDGFKANHKAAWIEDKWKEPDGGNVVVQILPTLIKPGATKAENGEVFPQMNSFMKM